MYNDRDTALCVSRLTVELVDNDGVVTFARTQSVLVDLISEFAGLEANTQDTVLDLITLPRTSLQQPPLAIPTPLPISIKINNHFTALYLGLQYNNPRLTQKLNINAKQTIMHLQKTLTKNEPNQTKTTFRPFLRHLAWKKVGPIVKEKDKKQARNKK